MSFIDFTPFRPLFNSDSSGGNPPAPVDENAYKIDSIVNEVESEIAGSWPINPVLRPSTKNNPFSNVPITAYDRPQVFSDYYRGPLSKLMSKDTEDNFTKKLYQNPGDKLFERENSQRQFYSVAVGSVPNNQEAFAENLYGNAYVCKSGSIWMNTGVNFTNDSLMCNGVNVSVPTNFGQLTRD